MKIHTIVVLCFFAGAALFCGTAHAEAPLELELVSTIKVWDQAPHNAFTDLVRFNDKWFMAFREGDAHVSSPPVGDIRVLSSDDGETWQSAALLQADDADLRDAKLSVTPEGQLMLVSGKRAVDNQGDVYMQSMVNFSGDGTTWGEASEIAEYNWWMWGTQWGPDGASYGVGYDCAAAFNGDPITTRLYRSEDGVDYDTIVSELTPALSNETSLLFRQDGSCVALVRRDKHSGNLVGVANGDYTDWTFLDMGQHIGGPEIIETPGGNILASGRIYEGGVPSTIIGLLDPEAGEFDIMLTLPSGGDCSYPGMVIHDGQLLVSYYSSHEDKTSIYLATMNLTGDTIPGDANNDKKVDGSDVTILAGNWQAGVDPTDTQAVTWSMGDFNGDGQVDGSDVTILAGNWQYGVAAAAATVPEPSTLAMLLALTAGCLVRRRR